MATELQWNVQERAQREVEGLAAAQQRQREEQQERKTLRGELAFWRGRLADHEAALPHWKAEHRRRREAQDAALLVYRAALHAETGGELPRASTGELVEVIDLEGAHPEAIASRAAWPQWEAYKHAVQETIYADSVVRRLNDAIPKLRHNVRVCEAAGAGRG